MAYFPCWLSYEAHLWRHKTIFSRAVCFLFSLSVFVSHSPVVYEWQWPFVLRDQNAAFLSHISSIIAASSISFLFLLWNLSCECPSRWAILSDNLQYVKSAYSFFLQMIQALTHKFLMSFGLIVLLRTQTCQFYSIDAKLVWLIVAVVDFFCLSSSTIDFE